MVALVKHAAGFARPNEDEHGEVIATHVVPDKNRRAGFTWQTARGKLFVPFPVLVPNGRSDPAWTAKIHRALVEQRDEGDIFTENETAPALLDGVERVPAR